MSISSISGGIPSYSSLYTDKARQKMQGNSGTAANGSTATDPVGLLGAATAIDQTAGGAATSAEPVSTPVQQFTDYMKETPQQRMQDAWLQEHGITQAQFDAMSPADQQKLLAEMKRELEEQMKQKADAETKGTKADLMA